MNLLKVCSIVLVLSVSKVVLIRVSLFVRLGQAVYQVVGRLISDVGQKPVHQWPVSLQLKLNGLSACKNNNKIVLPRHTCKTHMLIYTEGRGLSWGNSHLGGRTSGCNSACWCRRTRVPWRCHTGRACRRGGPPQGSSGGQRQGDGHEAAGCDGANVGERLQPPPPLREEPSMGCCTDCRAVEKK